eukprot:GSA120T00006940001.1
MLYMIEHVKEKRSPLQVEDLLLSDTVISSRLGWSSSSIWVY